MSEMFFNVVGGILRGSFSGQSVDCYAVSGGRGGAKLPNVGVPILQNNWRSTQVGLEKHGVGGTLPLGRYYMEPYPASKHAGWTRLTPLESTYMGIRKGMAIHGRGEEGSQGCIVPMPPGEDLKTPLMVENFIRDEKRKPVLEVVAVGHIPDWLAA